MVPINIKDQFIRGPSNTTLQIDILTKAGHLTILEETVKHAEAFETALLDQFKLNEIANLSISHIFNYRCQRQNSLTKLQRQSHGRGSTSYGAPESNNDHQNALHGGKIALTCSARITSVEYAQKKNETLTVQMPSFITRITIQLMTPTQTLLPIAKKKLMQI